MKRDGLYRRSGGIFCFRWKDKHSIWREKSCSTTDRNEAVDFKKNWDQRNQDDELPKDKAKWSVEHGCTRWVELHAVRLSPKAHQNERNYLRQLLKHPLSKKKLLSITLEDLQDYQRWRSEFVAARPINLELQILVRTLKENHLWRGELRGDPEIKNSGYQRLVETNSREIEAVSELDLQRLELVAASRDAWQVAHCAMIIAANTGLRGIELKRLRLKNVDLAAREITIIRKATKTDAGARSVYLNAMALAAMRRLVQRAELLGATLPDYLLPADLSRHTKATDPLKGKRGFDPKRHQESWSTTWGSLRKAAGFPNLGFHQLRHTFISRMAEEGVPLQITQAMVGHTTEEVTKRYTHISEKARRAAVEKLEAFRNPPSFVDAFVDESKADQSRPH